MRTWEAAAPLVPLVVLAVLGASSEGLLQLVIVTGTPLCAHRVNGVGSTAVHRIFPASSTAASHSILMGVEM